MYTVKASWDSAIGEWWFTIQQKIFKIFIHKMLIRIANREDPDQTASSVMKQSDLGLFCLSRPIVRR